MHLSLLSLVLALVSGQVSVDDVVSMVNTDDLRGEVSNSTRWAERGTPACAIAGCYLNLAKAKAYLELGFFNFVFGHWKNDEFVREEGGVLSAKGYAGISVFLYDHHIQKLAKEITDNPKITRVCFSLNFIDTINAGLNSAPKTVERLASVKEFLVRVADPAKRPRAAGFTLERYRSEVVALKKKFGDRVIFYCYQKDIDYANNLLPPEYDFYVKEVYKNFSPSTCSQSRNLK